MAEVWYLKKIRELENRVKGLNRENKEKDKKIEEQERKIKDLEAKLKDLAKQKTSKKPKFGMDYSLSRQEKLRNTEKGISTGRRTLEEKLKEVQREEYIYPKGAKIEDCSFVRSRIVTHFIDGKKEIVLYHIFRDKRGKVAQIPGVLPRTEYGKEIIVAIAFLMYVLQVSIEQCRQILLFFCDIDIKKSELDNLMNIVSEKWEKEFENICNILLYALVVHIDETGWKISAKNCFSWIFKTISHTVLLYGEKRSEEVLDRILPLSLFTGAANTDCYKMYEKRFKKAQKCWAHFLREAIKLMLLHPHKKKYEVFFEELLNIFRESKELKTKTLSQTEKQQQILILQEKIQKICVDIEKKMSKRTRKDTRTYVNLQKRLMRNMDDLFTFVLIEELEPTNNLAEQGLRNTAKARNNYQTSKTEKGAKRRSIITTVLMSLKQNLPEFTLKSINEEILKWEKQGKSMFDIQLEQLQRAQAP